MKSSHTILTERFLALLFFVSIVGGNSFEVLGQKNDSSEVFSSPVLDLGIVVKDLDKSASFYKDVIGCKEVKGFSAPPAFATSIGLVNEMEVVARVFVFGAGEKQSRLKMMSFPKAEASQTDQTYIHSTLGFSYLTLYVTDLSASIERLKKAKVTFLGKTPVPLGGKNALLVIRDPDGNFIELIGPMQD